MFFSILDRHSELSLKIKLSDTINFNIVYFYIWILYLFLIMMKKHEFSIFIFDDNVLEHTYLLTFSNSALITISFTFRSMLQ